VFTQDSVWSLSRTLLFGVYTLGGWFLLKRFWTSDVGNAVNILCYNEPHFVDRVTQSVRAGRVRDQIPVGMEFSVPGIHPPYCKNGTWSTPGVIVAGCAVHNLPSSSPAVVEENRYSSTHTGPVTRYFLLLCISYHKILNNCRQHNACRYSNCH